MTVSLELLLSARTLDLVSQESRAQLARKSMSSQIVQSMVVAEGVCGGSKIAYEPESPRRWSNTRSLRSQQRRRRGRFASTSKSVLKRSASAERGTYKDASATEEVDQESCNGSIADLLRLAGFVMWTSKISPPKGQLGEMEKPTWKPRTALDVSGHAFGKTLQEELRRAKQGCIELPSHDPHSAANRKRQLAGLQSPRGGFSSLSKDDQGTQGPASWEDMTSGSFLSRSSSSSTNPPTPPSARGKLPPRAPTSRSRGHPGSRRCTGYRRECAKVPGSSEVLSNPSIGEAVSNAVEDEKAIQ